MRLAICYVYPASKNGDQYSHQADRFVRTYRENPPLADHKMVVISNGGPPNGKAVTQFSWIAGTEFLQHDNSGLDIGAFQYAARHVGCEMMVFFGASTYFRRPGWLRRMINVTDAYGDHLYGCTGNQGDARVKVWPHVRTTGFWCSPKLINTHPMRVVENSQRYPWEHGSNCLTSWALLNDKQVWVVGWDCVKALNECDSMPEGFNKGQQRNLLVGDRLCAPPYYPHP
jgi:hypothetical protein